jgi:hypothetical protein
MKEFDYDLDYKSLDFTDAETRKLYRIGRGEQGVLLVRPYTNDICAHWRFVDEEACIDGGGGALAASNPVVPNLYPKLANALPRDLTPIIRHQCRH